MRFLARHRRLSSIETRQNARTPSLGVCARRRPSSLVYRSCWPFPPAGDDTVGYRYCNIVARPPPSPGAPHVTGWHSFLLHASAQLITQSPERGRQVQVRTLLLCFWHDVSLHRSLSPQTSISHHETGGGCCCCCCCKTVKNTQQSSSSVFHALATMPSAIPRGCPSSYP